MMYECLITDKIALFLRGTWKRLTLPPAEMPKGFFAWKETLEYSALFFTRTIGTPGS
jgi:hypothetical protein